MAQADERQLRFLLKLVTETCCGYLYGKNSHDFFGVPLSRQLHFVRNHQDCESHGAAEMHLLEAAFYEKSGK
jgi:hypothetical protein